ncbi:MAG: ABC transporter substrate-binding protein [Candidatus Marinimicrobia bacterium]|nr:ABC transporter substrate-binding protein [Candidatus Neomarinimicrobiota bacterium]
MDVEIRFWHSFVASTYSALKTTVNEFEKENYDIHINEQYVPTGDALVQKLITAAQSNTLPDIAWVHADFVDKLVKMDAVHDLDSFIEKDSSFSEDILKDILTGLLSPVTFEEKIFGLPMDATTLALVYNRDLFQKAGLSTRRAPANWEELEYYVKRLTKDKDQDGNLDQYGLYIPVFSASGPYNIWMVLQWTPFLWQAGGELMNSSRTEALYNSQAGIDALQFWKDLYEMQEFQSFSLAHDMGFYAQSVAMILDGPWNLPRYRSITDFEWEVAPLPAGQAGNMTYLSGEYLVIFKQTKYSEEAWQFIKWFLRTDIQARFAMRSGYLPTRESVLQDRKYNSYLDTHPKYKAFVQQSYNARTRLLPAENRVEFNQNLAEAIEKSIKGGILPKIALDEAAKKTNLLFNE